MNLLQYYFCFMFWVFGRKAHRILVPQSGIKPSTGRWGLTQWTVREIPFVFTEMQLVDNVVVVSGVQQCDSEYVFCFLHSLPLQVITRYSVELELCCEWESPIPEPSNFPKCVLQAGFKNAMLTTRADGRQRELHASWASYVPDTDHSRFCGCWAMPPGAANNLHYT